jgi:hypothetical protein
VSFGLVCKNVLFAYFVESCGVSESTHIFLRLGTKRITLEDLIMSAEETDDEFLEIYSTYYCCYFNF